MASGLLLKYGAIVGGILLVVVIIVACIAYFVGKNSAKKMQGGMNQPQMMNGMPYQQNVMSYQPMNGAPYQQPQMMNGAVPQPMNGTMQQPVNARFCTKCGKQDLAGKAFCTFCGNYF